MATKTAPWVLKLCYKGGQVPQLNALVKFPFSSENRIKKKELVNHLPTSFWSKRSYSVTLIVTFSN